MIDVEKNGFPKPQLPLTQVNSDANYVVMQVTSSTFKEPLTKGFTLSILKEGSENTAIYQ